MRAEYINEDDGSYTVKIKSPDGRRMVQFCAVKWEHERNREFAGQAVKRLGGASTEEDNPPSQQPKLETRLAGIREI